MRLARIFLTTLATLAFATSALGAGGTTTFVFGEDQNQLLLRTQITDLDASGDCMSIYQDTTADVTSQVCDIDLVNEVVWTQNAQVREIHVKTVVAGDAADNCEFNIEVAGTSIAAVENSLTQLVSTVEVLAVAVNLADGDLVGIMVENGEGCADGTSPYFIVELWGSFVADDAF
jgi:hypothetical protein